MYQQQVLCALPADVLVKVIVVVDKASEDNSYCTPKEGAINLLSKVRLGEPTTSGLLNYLWEEVGEVDADIPQLMVQIFN